MKRTAISSIVVLVCLLLSGCTKVSISIMGQVRNLGNHGIAGVTVELFVEDKLVTTATTASNGIYSLDNIRVNKDKSVSILASLGDYSDSAQLLVADSKIYLQDFTFPIPMGTLQITGHVYDTDDYPVEGAVIDFLLGIKLIGKTYTDANGYYSMPGLGAVPGDVISINASYDTSATSSQITVNEQLFYVQDMLLDLQQYPIEVNIVGKVFTGKFLESSGSFIPIGVINAKLRAYEIESDGKARYLGTTFSTTEGYYTLGNLFINEDSFIRVVITKDGYVMRQVDFDNVASLEGQAIDAWLHIWGLFTLSDSIIDVNKANLPVRVSIYYNSESYELDEDNDYFPANDTARIFSSYETSFDSSGVLVFDTPVPHWARIILSSPDDSGASISVLEGQITETYWW